MKIIRQLVARLLLRLLLASSQVGSWALVTPHDLLPLLTLLRAPWGKTIHQLIWFRCPHKMWSTVCCGTRCAILARSSNGYILGHGWLCILGFCSLPCIQCSLHISWPSRQVLNQLYPLTEAWAFPPRGPSPIILSWPFPHPLPHPQAPRASSPSCAHFSKYFVESAPSYRLC